MLESNNVHLALKVSQIGRISIVDYTHTVRIPLWRFNKVSHLSQLLPLCKLFLLLYDQDISHLRYTDKREALHKHLHFINLNLEDIGSTIF